jgi:hypothetical protein
MKNLNRIVVLFFLFTFIGMTSNSLISAEIKKNISTANSNNNLIKNPHSGKIIVRNVIRK